MSLFSVTIPDFDNTPHKIGENSTTVNIDAREGGLVLVEGNYLEIPAIIHRADVLIQTAMHLAVL